MPRYRAIIGDNQFDFDLNGENVFIDGSAFPCDIVDLGNGRLHMIVDGTCHSAHVDPNEDGSFRILIDGVASDVVVKSERDLLLEKYGIGDSASGGSANLKAPMPGLVVRIAVAPGDVVEKGDPLLVLEAMKMENELRALGSGKISSVQVSEGDAVSKNQLLIELVANQ
jgi:biotin carboxyl carrier protein